MEFKETLKFLLTWRKKKKPVMKNIKKKKLKDSYLKKAGKLNASHKNLVNDLTELVRSFFSSIFHIKYQFTYEELEKEMEEHKINKGLRAKIKEFTKRFTDAKFGIEEMKKQDMGSLINEFKEIIKEI